MIYPEFVDILKTVTKTLILVLIVNGLPMLQICALGHHPHDQIDALAVSPAYHEDQTIFIATGNHLQKSENGGGSWKNLIQGIEKERPVTSLAVSVSFKKDNTVFMGTQEGSIYKSIDGGLSWFKLSNNKLLGGTSRICLSPKYNDDGKVFAFGEKGGGVASMNGGKDWIDLFNSNTRIGDMAFLDFQEENTFLVGDNSGKLLYSKDDGKTWKALLDIPDSGGITKIAVSPNYADDRTIYLGTRDRGLIISTDGGKSFVDRSNLLNDKHIVSIGITDINEKEYLVFITTWSDAIFKSIDNGKTWIKHANGLTTDPQADSKEYRSPHFREISISNQFDEDNTILLAGFDGLFKSIDGGSNWKELETRYVGLIKGMAVTVNEKGSNEISLITYGGGAYFSKDGGSTWLIRNSGLSRTRLMDITFSPTYNSDHTVFSAASGSLLKSVDGGGRWKKILLKRDLSLNDRTKQFFWIWAKRFERLLGTSDLVSKRLPWKPQYGSKPYPAVVALSPFYDQDQTLYFGTRWHGVYKSTDGGQTCLNIGRELGRVLSVSMSPDYRTDRLVFANSLGNGLFKYSEKSKAWHEINEGLPVNTGKNKNHDVISSWRSIRILISPNFSNDKTLFAGTPEGMYRSVDKGELWDKIGQASIVKNGHISGMNISPFFEVDRTLMVSVFGKGLYRSYDGGETFTEIATNLIEDNHLLEFIAFSSQYNIDHTIYGASEEHVFKSTDNGDSWRVLKRPIRYENHRDAVDYSGQWIEKENENYSATKVSYSNIPGDSTCLDFVGEGVKWIGTKGPNFGIAQVFIDGTFQHDVDLYNEKSEPMSELFTDLELPYGTHRICIDVSQDKNNLSNGKIVEIDAFDVYFDISN